MLARFPIFAAAGGSFLLEDRNPNEIFTPEDMTEEQQQIAATAARFAREEILPAAAAIEAKEPGVLAATLGKAAELGFTGVDIPEEYGGMGMDKISLDVNYRPYLGAGELLDGLWGASRDRNAAPGLVRDGGAEAEVSAEAGNSGVDCGVFAVGVQLGIGCDERADAGDSFRGW